VEQARGERELTRLLVESPENPSKPANHLSNGSLVGRIRIPELDLSAVVFEGTDESVLRKGVGHLAGTAFPFESGNVVLAAHRDTFFRKLKDIRDGDTVSLDTPWGRYQYQVSSTQVVSPDAVEVIRPTEVPTLTLITCYPFYFFGHAPERFIVSARRMED
jgi:sortase A